MARLLILTLAVIFSLPAAAQTCERPQGIGDGWTIALPGDVGLDTAKLCTLEALLEAWPKRNIHAVVVARRGRLVFERYFGGLDDRWVLSSGLTQFSPTEKHDVRSISKSVTSML